MHCASLACFVDGMLGVLLITEVAQQSLVFCVALATLYWCTMVATGSISVCADDIDT
jgi:hypothetical protein